jgi:hypothetical protein
VFGDKSRKPTNDDLAAAIGRSVGLWNELKQKIGLEFEPLSEEWVFSGKSYGWSLRLKHKERAILYLKPCEGHFRVSFALGEKAANAAHDADLPASVLKLIDNAPKYPEGRAVRLEVRSRADIRLALKIAQIKMAK